MPSASRKVRTRLQNLAEVQYALNQKNAAVSTLRKALAMDPTNREYIELLAKWAGLCSGDRFSRPVSQTGTLLRFCGNGVKTFQRKAIWRELTSQLQNTSDRGCAWGGISRIRVCEPTLSQESRKAFSLLPEDVLELFLSEKRLLTILIEPDLKIRLEWVPNERAERGAANMP